jgi:hypothetical protein
VLAARKLNSRHDDHHCHGDPPFNPANGPTRTSIPPPTGKSSSRSAPQKRARSLGASLARSSASDKISSGRGKFSPYRSAHHGNMENCAAVPVILKARTLCPEPRRPRVRVGPRRTPSHCGSRRSLVVSAGER